MTTASTYAEFAAREAHGVSPAYERLAFAVADDAELLALLERLPPAKRQPNLLFGVVRLRAAAAVAAADPPLLVRGDLVDDLPALAAQAPPGATLVVFHSSVLYHVPPPRRAEFVQLVRRLPGHWVANEAPAVLPHAGTPKPPGEVLHQVLALGGRPLAWTRQHGQELIWFGPRMSR